MLGIHEQKVATMVINVTLFLLSALGLFTAAKEFLRRGHNLGLWP
jgi:hypothetical protein